MDAETVKAAKLLVLAKLRSDHGSLWVEKRKRGRNEMIENQRGPVGGGLGGLSR